MTSPRATVCIPVYNGSIYIAQSIESVLKQTYEDFRLIVCDNCSTDNTADIVRSFDDSRITYLCNDKNLGLVGNSNRCIEVADSEYVYILHHDDLMTPKNLECKVRLLDEHPEVGFVHSNLSLINSEGEVVADDIWYEGSRRDYIEDGRVVFRRYLAYLPFGASIFIGTVLARKECYRRVGGFNPALPHCTDSELLMRMLLSYDVACVGIPLVKYRVHPESTSSSWGGYTSPGYIKEHYLAATMIFDAYKDRIHEAESLRRQVSLSFGERLLDLAWSACSGGDFDLGKTLLKEAMNVYPDLFRNSTFWKTAARLSAGSLGLKLYRAAKNHFGENHG